jgi:hypothetical protein
MYYVHPGPLVPKIDQSTMNSKKKRASFYVVQLNYLRGGSSYTVPSNDP